MKHSLTAILAGCVLIALNACATEQTIYEPVNQRAAKAPVQKSNSNSVSFNDVLSNPEDPKLNLKYAKQQARKGNLLRAISAMERLLLAEPAWDGARYYYMTLLTRVGDDTAAARQFAILENRPLDAGLRRKVNSYRNKIAGPATFEPLL